MTVTHVYKVAMTCEGCCTSVKKVLEKLKDKGVEDVDVNLASNLVKVKTTLAPEDVLEVIKKTGKKTEFVETLK